MVYLSVLDFPNPGVISGYLSQTGSCSMYMSEYRSRWGEGVLYKFSKSKSLNNWGFFLIKMEVKI